MALSVKVALLTCLFFTGGLCWLVNQVSRPTDGRGPSVAQRTLRDVPSAAPVAIVASEPTEKTAQLERVSPVARSRDAGEPAARTVVVPEVRLTSDMVSDRPIPPLHNPLLEMRTAAEVAQRDARSGDAAPVDQIPSAVFAMETAPRGMLEAHRTVTPYTVQKGDSISKICRVHYGAQSAAGQKLVLAENPQVARRAGNTIFLGETLQIPALGGAPVEENDTGGMEASASFVTEIVPAPETAPEARPKKSAPKRTERTASAGKTVQTPPKADTVPANSKPASGKMSAKTVPTKNAGSALAAAGPGAKDLKSAQPAPEPRSAKSPSIAARRNTSLPPKAAPAKRSTSPDKRDARRPTSGGVVLAKRD
jgi:hypothetical protein